MRYKISEKILCLGDDFRIRDEHDNDAYYVDGRALSFGDKLSMRDSQGNEVALIDQKLLAWGPTYEIYRNGELAAVVKKHLFTFLRCRFSVDVPGPDDLEAEGSFTDHEYVFRQGTVPVATVSKKWFAWTDSYAVDIAPGVDPVLILASAVVIDLVCHPDDRKH